ncbi:GNAT family N-acetyltransferase [Candidatus Woesearchaeota archaeon]|nr:GNAT family N-acetyltransferase [Candidatus Woesearchaeota archaeon]
MKIRKFRKQDAYKVSHLLRITQKQLKYPKKVIDTLRRNNTPSQMIKRSKEREYWVLEHKGKILGMIGIVKNEAKTLFIVPKCQNKGYGSLLLNHIENIARKRKYRKIVGNATPSAEKFYKKHGWKRIKRIMTKIDDVSFPVIYMEKKL